MRALSIRQPYAELIMRGIKRIEFRSRPTSIIGQRFYIYASQQWAVGKLFLEGCGPRGGTLNDERRTQNEEGEGQVAIIGDNIEVPRAGTPEPWMLELAKMLILRDLPRGVIVGTAVISECRSQKSDVRDQEEPDLLTSDLRPLTSDLYEWHLADVQRAKKFRKPTGRPQPVWFNPF